MAPSMDSARPIMAPSVSPSVSPAWPLLHTSSSWPLPTPSPLSPPATAPATTATSTYSLFPPLPLPAAPFHLNPTPPLMPPPSLPQVTDSARQSSSKRQSVASATPSDTPTANTAGTNATNTTGTTAATASAAADPRSAALRTLQRGLDRLERPRLQQQRYEPSREKSESISKLALGAKVERALGRRMTGQDAVLRVKSRPLVVVVPVGGGGSGEKAG